MHKEIFSSDQQNLLPLLSIFKREFFLAGDTAVALHIGHRRSVDFDLFKFNALNHKNILQKIQASSVKYTVIRSVSDQLNVIVQRVKLTFFQYPYEIPVPVQYENMIKMPDLITLAAMKAFALGRRSKWKDYVDLFFLMKHHFTIDQIAEKAGTVFNELFAEKLFRAQLCFFDDVDYTERVEFMGIPVSEEEIKAFLTEKALAI